MAVDRIDRHPKWVRGIRCRKRELRWVGVESKRNGECGVRLPLVSGRILEPHVESKLTRFRQGYVRKLTDVRRCALASPVACT
jgi:hypothetical protein